VEIKDGASSDLHHVIQVVFRHIFEMLSVARPDRQRYGNTLANAENLF
jgi:hypothetical protein